MKLSGSSRHDAPVPAIPNTPPSTRRWFFDGGGAFRLRRNYEVREQCPLLLGHQVTDQRFLPSRGATESASAVFWNLFWQNDVGGRRVRFVFQRRSQEFGPVAKLWRLTKD